MSNLECVEMAEIPGYWEPYLDGLYVTNALMRHIRAVGDCAEFGRPGSRVAAETYALERAAAVQQEDRLVPPVQRLEPGIYVSVTG